MPTCRRKRVLLTEPSPALLDALKHDPTREVFYLEETGEIFENYEYGAGHIMPPGPPPADPPTLQCLCSPDVLL